MTYYTLENNTLRKVGNVIRTTKGWVTNPSVEDCAAVGAYPRSEESFAPPAVDEGSRAVADGYDLKDGKWARKWRIEELPPPPPRTFSKFKVVRLLTEMGTWLKVRDYIVAKGLYDLFLAAQDFKEDDQFFVEGLTALKGELGLADEQIEEILKKCEV